MTWCGPMSVAGFIWLLLSLSLLGQSTLRFSTSSLLVNEDAGQAVATVRRANDLDRIVTVDYSTIDGTATAGQDYVATVGTLTFAAGQTNQTILVPILNDGWVEGSEVLRITLSNPSEGALLGLPNYVNIRIGDNDTGPHFTSTTYDTVQDVGTLWIEVHRGDDGDQPVTVDYGTVDGTALAGTDYEVTQGTLSFQGDETFKEMAVVILNDGVNDPDKSFQVQLSNASSGGVGNPSLTTVTIQDPTPVIFTQPTPANQSVSLGGTVKIQVSAKGARMQWQHRVGEGEFTDIPGASGQVLEWSSATVDLNGDYRFVVSSSTGETVTSHIARVEVDPTFTKVTKGPHVTDSGNARQASWGDYDNDGDLDLLVGRDVYGGMAGENTLYVNNGDGTFTRVTQGLPSTAFSYMVMTWADFDNDGWLDYFAANYSGLPMVFGYNNGDGTFTQNHLDTDPMPEPWHVAVIDYDRDGFLDLYLPNGNRLYRGLGDRRFERMTAAEVGAGILTSTYAPSAWADFDDDGWSDAFVGRGGLYRSDRAGAFVHDNAASATVGSRFTGAWGDFDNDGRIDLATGDFGQGLIRVYRNLGRGEFEAMPFTLSVPVCNGIAWADFDNDGFLDLSATAYSEGRRKLFRNNGDGTFTEILAGSLVTEHRSQGQGQGFLWFDYDDDGFLDLYVPNFTDRPPTVPCLYRTNPNGNTWLKVKLLGNASNSGGIGAKVRVHATYAGEDRWQRRDITGGDHYNGHGTLAHFGLGDATKVDTIRIEWPSGIVQELKDVAAHQILHVVESQDLILPEPLSIQTFELDATGVFHATVNCSVDGAVCVLESSSDLERWTKVRVRTSSGGTVELTDGRAGDSPGKFYRVLVP
jgi:hypothetical protein